MFELDLKGLRYYGWKQRLGVLFVCLFSNSFNVQILGCRSLPGTAHGAKSTLSYGPTLSGRGGRHLCLDSYFFILIYFLPFPRCLQLFLILWGVSLIATVLPISCCLFSYLNIHGI